MLTLSVSLLRRRSSNCFRLRNWVSSPTLLLSHRKRLLSSFSGSSDGELEIDDPGDYEIILPPEPLRWGVDHIPIRDVPENVLKPPYAVPGRTTTDSDPYTGDGRIGLGSEDENKLRQASKLAKQTLSKASELICVGVSTNEIDAALHEFVISNNAYPSPLRYAGFPKSCCTSVNNVVVHGIPDDRKFVNGDIVNIDITVYLDGFHGDTSRTFLVGEVDPIGRELVESADEALDIGIQQCRPGSPFKSIGAAIHTFAISRNLSVSDQFTGHGIGRVFHRPPWILHHKNEEPGIMLPGHCFTIEPALIVGPNLKSWIFPDGWTASTIKGSRSAQAEHTILITDHGADVLTR